MASNPIVTFLCKRTVVSTKPVQPGKRHSLSVLDRLMAENHVKMVYYLKTSHAGKYYEPGEITKSLRESLAETLTFFPIMTGRLVKEEDGRSWMVKCNDAGVRMVEARAQGSVEEWLAGNVDREREMELVHWEEMFHKPYFWSTFYVQITEFEGGGVAIGFSCFHLLADPVCATMFVKAWADIALLGKMQHPPFFHALPTPKHVPNPCLPRISETNDLIAHYKGTTMNESVATVNHNDEPSSQVATFSFSFTDAMVESCMARAGSSAREASPFEVLSGLFWVCLSKLKREGDGGLMEMCICLDARKALGLDSGFFGNCMVSNRVRCSNRESLSVSTLLFGAVASVRETVEDMMNPNSVMGLIEWLRCRDRDPDTGSEPVNCGDSELVCIGLDGVDPYSVRFDDGFEPIRVSSYVEPVGEKWQVLILPAPDERGRLGRVVMVTIPKEFAGSLHRSDLIRDLCSNNIVMGMNDGI